MPASEAGASERNASYHADGAPSLARVLGLRDLVLFNLVAVLGLRWLATAAKAGPSAIALWLLAALFFFVPQGLVVTELSSRFPEEGGIYQWTKRALGERHGYLCGWCYWINNVLYYPNLLISTAVIATYAIGKGDCGAGVELDLRALGDAGVSVARGAAEHRGRGHGEVAPECRRDRHVHPRRDPHRARRRVPHRRGRPSANPITAQNIVPDLRSLDELNLWASIAFAFAGLELSSAMGGEVRNPRRTLPRAILIAAPLIAPVIRARDRCAAPPRAEGRREHRVGLPAGDRRGRARSPRARGGSRHSRPSPTRSATSAAWARGSPDRRASHSRSGSIAYFPPAFGRVHPRWKTPYVAIIVQAALATVFLLLSVLGKGTTVEKAYLIILDTQLLVYFIPYVYLFISFLMHRRTEAPPDSIRVPGGTPGAWLVGLSGLFVTLFAMGVAMVPPGDTDPWLFELKVIGGALGFVAIGGMVYWRRSAVSA